MIQHLHTVPGPGRRAEVQLGSAECCAPNYDYHLVNEAGLCHHKASRTRHWLPSALKTVTDLLVSIVLLLLFYTKKEETLIRSWVA